MQRKCKAIWWHYVQSEITSPDNERPLMPSPFHHPFVWKRSAIWLVYQMRDRNREIENTEELCVAKVSWQGNQKKEKYSESNKAHEKERKESENTHKYKYTF